MDEFLNNGEKKSGNKIDNEIEKIFSDVTENKTADVPVKKTERESKADKEIEKILENIVGAENKGEAKAETKAETKTENKEISSSSSPEEQKSDRPPEKVNISRKEKVEKFVLKIDEDSSAEKKADTVSNRPSTKGAVYFGNYQRRPGEKSAPQYTGNNPQGKKPVGAKNTYAGKNVDMFTDSKGNPSQAKNGKGKPVDGKTADGKKRRKTFTDRQFKIMNRVYTATLCICLLISLVATVVVSLIGIDCINDVLALSVSEEEVEITIPNNITTDEAIDLFYQKGLIKVPWFCKFFAEFRGYEQEGIYYFDYIENEEKIKPYIGGTYYLSRSMGLEGMLNVLLDNSITSEQTVSITFPEGYTIAQIVNRLEDYEIISNSNKFVSASNYNYQYEFLDSTNKGMALNLEGYLFPDTYDMYIGESTSSIIKRFLTNFDERWTSDYKKRAKELGYTTSEILTIASIIQKEAAGPEQMADISSVLHNRLKKSSTYPMLQCDSTANYVNVYLVDLFGEKKAKTYLSKYDTDVCIGLPVGPICNPGLDAIHAALYPSETDYMYFCHDKSGKVYYAVTDYEHQQNVALIS